MQMRRAMASGVCIALGACAGDGAGLDENGRPIEDAPQTLQPTLASIQSNVFTPICTTCHSGAAAPLGLRLDEGAAFAMLVNAQSTEQPALLRVAPGNPDASYLIQKLEGTAAVGARMPLNAPALPPETIAVIRQWIVNGAAAQASASVSMSRPVIKAAWPPNDAALAEPPREIVLSANVELDASLLDAGVVTLRASGGDGDFTNGNEITIDARAASRSLDPSVITLTAPQSWKADHYELRISGGAPLALADRNAQLIDGDEDGAPGGDFVLRFSVETSR